MTEDLLQRLQTSISEARTKYKSATDSLLKLNGQNNLDRKRPLGSGHRDSENGSGADPARESGGPAKRARAGGVFQRLAASPSEPQQQHAAAPMAIDRHLADCQRLRKAAIKEQSASEDSQVRARNKRMFGVMLGTLKQFSAAERDRERQLSYQQRRELEQRVEEGVKRDQERLQRECEDLAAERKRRQAEIARLEEQVRLVELHTVWRHAAEQLRGSIRTLADSHPHRLYYRPKVFCERARRRRELTARQIDTEMAERGRCLRADVDRAMRDAAEAADVYADDDDSKAKAPAKRVLSSVAIVVSTTSSAGASAPPESSSSLAKASPPPTANEASAAAAGDSTGAT